MFTFLAGCKTPIGKETGCNHMMVGDNHHTSDSTSSKLTSVSSAYHLAATPTFATFVASLSLDLHFLARSTMPLALTIAFVNCLKMFLTALYHHDIRVIYCFPCVARYLHVSRMLMTSRFKIQVVIVTKREHRRTKHVYNPIFRPKKNRSIKNKALSNSVRVALSSPCIFEISSGPQQGS